MAKFLGLYRKDGNWYGLQDSDGNLIDAASQEAMQDQLKNEYGEDDIAISTLQQRSYTNVWSDA